MQVGGPRMQQAAQGIGEHEGPHRDGDRAPRGRRRHPADHALGQRAAEAHQDAGAREQRRHPRRLPSEGGNVYAVVEVWTWIASSDVPSVAPVTASITPALSHRGDGWPEASSVLGLELAVVVANEGADVIGHVE